MCFAELVKSGRKTLKMSQSNFADFLGVPLPTIQGWERTNSKEPNQATINYVKVAIAYPEIVRDVIGKIGNR